ncbi:MAG: cation transporter [Pseudomonadota bacterium]
MSGCCEPKSFDGVSEGYKKALWAVIGINAVMFCVEIMAGMASRSQALKADALDFAGDAATYTLSLCVIGAALKTRARASLIKAASLGVMALFILATTAIRVSDGRPPEAQTMSLIGMAALVANLISVFILLRWRDGDSNVRSVWLCSRNDAIGNVGVMCAGLLVAATGAAWPDLAMAALLAGLFLRSFWAIFGQALSELNHDHSMPGKTAETLRERLQTQESHG